VQSSTGIQIKTHHPPKWCSGLAVPLEILDSSPGSVAADRAREAHGAVHNWPSVVRVRECLAGRDVLVSSCTSDSCGGPGAVHACYFHTVPHLFSLYASILWKTLFLSKYHILYIKWIQCQFLSPQGALCRFLECFCYPHCLTGKICGKKVHLHIFVSSAASQALFMAKKSTSAHQKLLLGNEQFSAVRSLLLTVRTGDCHIFFSYITQLLHFNYI
jgi:hypothetical protein